MSHVALDLASKVAPFEQIKASIIGPLAAGELPADHKLPAGRRFRVAPNTVVRAYRELKADGLIRSRGHRGTSVVGLPIANQLNNNPLTAAAADAQGNGALPRVIFAAVIAALARPG